MEDSEDCANFKAVQRFKLLAKENGVQRLDEDFLQRFLVGHQYNTYSALKAVRNFESFVSRRRDTWLKQEKSRVENILQSQIVDVLEKDGLQEQKIVWIRLEKWNPDTFTADEILEVSGLLCELVYAKTRDIRYIDVIIDCHKFSLKHLQGLSRKFAKRMIFFMSECLPMELLHIYVVRQPKIFYLAYSVYKPFIEDRMRRLIQICGYDYDCIIENIGRETLPLELHGTSDPLMARRWLNELYLKNTQKELEKSGYQFYDETPSQPK